MYAVSKVKLVLAILLTANLAAPGQDHWRQMIIRTQSEYHAGIIGGESVQHMQGITRCASRPDIIYLSHDCNQVWISRDNGDSWKRVTGEDLWLSAGQGIAVDPVNPDKVLIIMDASFDYRKTQAEGIYLSEDAGETWSFTQYAPGDHIRHYQGTIVYDPTRVGPDEARWWYAARGGDALYQSTDGGHTWVAVESLTGKTDVYSIQCHITDGHTLYLGCEDGLFVSYSYGAGLMPLGDLPAGTVSAISMHPTEPETMFVTVQGIGLYKSTDGGASFTRIYNGNAYYGIVNPGHPDKIFLVMVDGDVRVSSNGGASWALSNTYNYLGAKISYQLDGPFSNISPDPRDANVCTIFSNAHCWKTTNGRDFQESGTRLTGYACAWWEDTAAFDVGDPDRFVLFCFDVGMAVTENGGLWFDQRPVPYSWYTSGQLSWISMHAGDLYPETGSDILLMAAGQTFDLRMVRSTDFGVTKTIVNTDGNLNLIVQFNRNDPTIVYAGNKRSTDTGQTFVDIPLLAANGGTIVGVAPSNNDIVYAMDGDERTIYRSDDAGVTWRQYVSTSWRMGLHDSRPSGFAVHPTNPDWVYTMYLNTGTLGRFDGTSWTDMNLPDLPIPITHAAKLGMIQIDPRHPEIMYVEYGYTGGPQIFRSLDGGASWQDITFNLPRAMGGLKVHPLTGDVLVGSCCGSFILPAPYADGNSLYANMTPDAPVAVAPDGMVVRDTDGDGVALVSLDATASYAVDSTIISYQWQADGLPIGSGAVTLGPLGLGEHLVKITVTDDNFVQAYDTFSVTVLAGLDGDANGDGEVDIQDFVILKQNYGTPAGATWEMGDFNEDGAVDIQDFVILKQNYGV